MRCSKCIYQRIHKLNHFLYFFSQSLQQVAPTESKAVKEKVVKTLELCQFLVKLINQQVGLAVSVRMKSCEGTIRVFSVLTHALILMPAFL